MPGQLDIEKLMKS